jgi:hypothetical protein
MYHPTIHGTKLTEIRVDDDTALRAKVDEALAVYDDYMKSKQQQTNGTKEEESGEAAA